MTTISGMNKLIYGDNLLVLREHVADESVDLIYLDPPFNSKRDYNLLFKSPKGHQSDAQIEAFADTWHWCSQAEDEFDQVLKSPNTAVAAILRAFRDFLGQNDMMAYLTMMANRLLEMHRVLKPTGSLYLHCDPTASHYLKIMLDGVLGKENFRNEITWKRTSSHNDSNRYGANTDTIFFYTKSERWKWNQQHTPHDKKYLSRFRNSDEDGRLWQDDNLSAKGLTGGGYHYTYKGISGYWRCPLHKMKELDAKGRLHFTGSGGIRIKRYLDENKGNLLQSLWTDIPPINSQAAERLGYPTQKPLALLERIISASSNKGDVILDPFCGCGTAVHAAHKLKRQWVGIDITHLAISLIEKRLRDSFGKRCEFEVCGTPEDFEGARDLADRDKYQFQWWALSLVNAQPFQGKKKGPDSGIDGVKYFRDVDGKEAHKIVVSVKGGKHLKADDVRALNTVRERERAEIGILISLSEPTKGMLSDAASAGFYDSPNGKKYARMQLLSVGDLIEGRARAEHPDYEPDLNFKKASAESDSEQQDLL